MKRTAMILALAALAFGLGATGAPGKAIAAAAVYLVVPEGSVHVDAPTVLETARVSPPEGG